MVPLLSWSHHPKEYTRPTLFVSRVFLQKESYTKKNEIDVNIRKLEIVVSEIKKEIIKLEAKLLHM
jgi:hypothetical protein